jgi:hypothetical protein
MTEITNDIYTKSLESTIEYLRKMADIKEEIIKIHESRIAFAYENIEELQKIIADYQRIILDYKKLIK